MAYLESIKEHNFKATKSLEFFGKGVDYSQKSQSVVVIYTNNETDTFKYFSNNKDFIEIVKSGLDVDRLKFLFVDERKN